MFSNTGISKPPLPNGIEFGHPSKEDIFNRFPQFKHLSVSAILEIRRVNNTYPVFSGTARKTKTLDKVLEALRNNYCWVIPPLHVKDLDMLLGPKNMLDYFNGFIRNGEATGSITSVTSNNTINIRETLQGIQLRDFIRGDLGSVNTIEEDFD